MSEEVGATERDALTPIIGRILIVDDQKPTRDLFQRAMRSASIPADTCASAAEARNKINEGGIILVLVDILMPDEGGRTLADWVAMKHPKIKIVFITGDASAAEEDLRYDTIVKPVTPQRLVELMRWYLDRIQMMMMLERVIETLDKLNESFTPSGIVGKFVSDKALMVVVSVASVVFGAYAKKMGWI